MAEDKLYTPSPPETLSEFIERLSNPPLDPLEHHALQAWCSTAINLFLTPQEVRKSPRVVAYLSKVAPVETSTTLLRNVANAIIDGTKDGTSLDPVLLQSIAYIIRQMEEKKFDIKAILGSLFDSMKGRLESAKKQGIPEAQYEVVSTLGTVIDAMADIGVSGISHESLYKPLSGLLDGLSEDSELHLAHAAYYAREALRRIKDDDTIGDASLRGMICAIDLAMMVIGAATTMDPGKIWEALKSGVEGGQRLKNFSLDNLKKHADNSCYIALRTIDFMIRGRDWEELVRFIRDTRQRNHKDFLCGLFYQLEKAHSFLPEKNGKQIYKMILEHKDKDERVQAWARLSIPSYIEQEPSHETERTAKQTKSKKPLKITLRNKKTYEWSIKPFNWKSASYEYSGGDDGFLHRAFSECETAKEYYTKTALLKYYSSNRILEIQRLSLDPLPVESCYINLRILEISQSEDIPLPELFNTRKMNGREIKPQKIFIEGQAGVGKTTLCKKIVFDFLHQRQWSDRFDWILWLPLRNLKTRSANSCSMKDLFHDEYFSYQYYSDLFAEKLDSVVKENGTHVLFVLDGLDEISQEWNVDTPINRLLRSLLQKPRVIVSSRPHHMDQIRSYDIDLNLRTVGFSEGQIEKYVHTIESGYTAVEICSFIKEHPRMLGIAQIPVQLDAICCIWRGLGGSLDQTETMTTIYQAISRNLLKKDLCRMEKKNNQKSITEQAAKEISEFEIEGLMKEDVNIIEGLAFHGFCNGMFEFDMRTRSQIAQHLKKKDIHIPLMIESSLKYLSFLRTSNIDSSIEDQTFHFLHLTYQEFFAARLFATHWALGSTIPMLRIRQRQGIDISTREFLAQNKYEVRYFMFWRFIAGILYCAWKENRSKAAERQILDFFLALETDPRDLLGLTHQDIVMHCLSEVPHPPHGPLGFESYRETLYQQLAGWATREIITTCGTRLAKQEEFPDQSLYATLRDASPETMTIILMGIYKRIRVDEKVTDLLASFLDDRFLLDPCKKMILRMLLKNFSALSPKTSDVLIHHIDDEPLYEIYTGSHEVSTLPKQILDILVRRLKDHNNAASMIRYLGRYPVAGLEAYIIPIAERLADEEPRTKAHSIWFLAHQPDVPPNVINSVIECIKNGDAYLRNEIVENLPFRTDTSTLREILKCFISLLAHGELRIRDPQQYGQHNTRPKMLFIQSRGHEPEDKAVCSISKIFSYWSELPSDIVDLLVEMLSQEQPEIQQRAVLLLSHHSYLLEKEMGHMTQILKHGDELDKREIIISLQTHPQLPQDILYLLCSVLGDSSPSLAAVIVDTLAKAEHLSEFVLNSLTDILSHDNNAVRSQVARALGISTSLPRRTLDSIVECLKDREESVRIALVEALGSQSSMLQHILDSLKRQLNDESSKVRAHMLEVIGKHRSLASTELSFIINCLKDEDSSVRLVTVRSLQFQLPTPDVSRSLVDRLYDEDERVRAEAVNTIAKHPRLLRKELHFAIQLLRDKSSAVRQKALIQFQQALPPEALPHLVECSDDPDKTVRYHAMKALGFQLPLPTNALHLLVKMVNEGKDDIKDEARDILIRQSNLPDDVLLALTELPILQQFSLRASASLGILESQKTLPREVINILASYIRNYSGEGAFNVGGILIHHAEFYTMLPQLSFQHIRRCYQVCLSWSFQERYIMYFHRGRLVVDFPTLHTEIPMSLYHRTKLRCIFWILQIEVTREPEIQIAKERINEWRKWAKIHQNNFLFALIASVMLAAFSLFFFWFLTIQAVSGVISCCFPFFFNTSMMILESCAFPPWQSKIS